MNYKNAASETSVRVAVTALYLFAFCAWFLTAPAFLFLTVLLVVTLVQGRRLWPLLRRDALFWVLFGYIVYIVLRGLAAGWEFPETAKLQHRDIEGFVLLALFPLLALWLKDNTQRVYTVLLLAAVGLVLDLLHNMEWQRVLAAFQGQSYGFGKAHIGLGLYAGTIVLGLVLLAPRFWQQKTPAWRWAGIVGWLLLLVFFLQILILTQSRGAWLSVFAVFPLVVIAWAWSAVKHGKGKQVLIAIVATVALVAVVLVAGYADVIKKRLGQEHQTYNAILSADLDKIPNSSVGVRIHAFAYGLQKWWQRPLFGWGTGDTKWLLKQHPTNGAVRVMAHFHNQYIELLVRLGLVGFLLAAAIVGLLLIRLWRCYRAGRVAKDMFLFLGGSYGLIAVWGLSAHRMTHVDWGFYWLLLSGACYAFILAAERPAEAAA